MDLPVLWQLLSGSYLDPFNNQWLDETSCRPKIFIHFTLSTRVSLTLDIDIEPCTCEPCTRRCTTPGVRVCGPPMRARLVRSAPLPCNSARASPVVHPRHSVNMWMWSSPKEGQTTLTGIITVSWRMEAKVKRNGKTQWGKAALTEPATESCRAGFDGGGSGSKSIAAAG